MNKERIGWIDTSKCIGIMLVIIGHFLPDGNFMKVAIYSFHVPLFFVLSGYVLNTKYSLDEFISKRFKQLIFSYLFWGVLSLPYYLIHKIPFSQIVIRFSFVSGYTIWNDPLWFLIILFFVEIILYLLYKAFNDRNFITILPYICFTCIIIGFIVYLLIPRQIAFFGYEKVLLLFPFYAFGYILREKKVIAPRKYQFPIYVLIFVSNFIISGIINNGDNISILSFDVNNYWIFIITSIIGTFSLINICVFFKNSRLLTICSRYILQIMCTHYLFIYIWVHFFGSQSTGLAVLGAIITIGFYASLILVLDKFSYQLE